MRSLLDVSVLLALLDTGHVHHDRAFDWIDAGGLAEGWSSWPITENAVLRSARRVIPARRPAARTQNQITDAYLVAQAVEHGGRFVTRDQAVGTDAVPGTRSDVVEMLRPAQAASEPLKICQASADFATRLSTR